MLKKVTPAVVNIATYSEQEVYNPLFNDSFFRRFFGFPDTPGRGQERPFTQRRKSAGSGVVINAEDGVIVTNYHVIKGSDSVHVTLLDGRNYKADIIGFDSELDIAVIEIDAKNLQEIPLGDSSKLEVGDFVVAIGNPFGLGQTVTTGIISALERTGLGIEGYENFIQTDASINPGNSGGALVSLSGELIGINTAIISPAGGNVGIGFAIPSKMANYSINQILKHGEVRRGRIGVFIQNINPDLREIFELDEDIQGVIVTDVVVDSPAEDAGIKVDDIIISVDGIKTTSVGKLKSIIGIRSLGDKVKITLLRKNKRKSISVKVEEFDDTTLTTRHHDLLEGARFENSREGDGVVVAFLAPNSKAAYSGLRIGDIIVAANRRKVYDLESFNKALKRETKKILFHVKRNGYSFYLVIQ